MRSLKVAFLLVLLSVASLTRAQQRKVLSASSSTCTATSCLSVTVDPTQGGATFTVSANASGNTISFQASGDGGTTIVPINATPSNSSTAVSSTTSTGTWQVNTSGYTNIYLIMTAFVGGTTTVNIIQSTASARGGSASGGGGAGAQAVTSIPPTAVSTATNILIGVTTNATQLASVYVPFTVSAISTLGVNFTTGDNSANLYDVGMYGPGCLNGAVNVPLVFHIGATAGTTLGSNQQRIALANAPVTNIVPGWYCFAYTSNGASPLLRIGGDAVSIHIIQFANAASPGGSTGTTVNGVLNPTITAPALLVSLSGGIYFTAY